MWFKKNKWFQVASRQLRIFYACHLVHDIGVYQSTYTLLLFLLPFFIVKYSPPVVSVAAMVCLQPLDHLHLFPINLPAPGVSLQSKLFIYSLHSLCSLPDCLCVSPCVDCFPALFLVFNLMVCDFALLLGFWIFACSLPAIVWLCLIDYSCMTSNFLSRDIAVLNFTQPPVSFSASDSCPELLHSSSVLHVNKHYTTIFCYLFITYFGHLSHFA